MVLVSVVGLALVVLQFQGAVEGTGHPARDVDKKLTN